MATPWYVATVSWLPREKDPTLEEQELFKPQRLVWTLDRDHILDGARCGGFLYDFNFLLHGDGEAIILKEEIQRFQSHFWSHIIQTPFYKVPIAFIIPSRQEWAPLLEKVLSLSHIQPGPIQYFYTLSEAAPWLVQQQQQIINKKPADEWPPIVYSSIS